MRSDGKKNSDWLRESEFFFPSDLIPTQRTCETSHKKISHLKSIAVEQLC